MFSHGEVSDVKTVSVARRHLVMDCAGKEGAVKGRCLDIGACHGGVFHSDSL